MNRSKMFAAVWMLMLLSLILMVSAYSSQVISYQGFLTDSDGSPVADGDYILTFTIYDGGGVEYWTSGPQDVPVSNGAFHHNLGSVVSIPDDVFDISPLYLGIKIGADPEIAPKTLLTSAPGAAVATNLYGGSVETDDGILVLKNTSGDTAMVFTGDPDYHGIRVVPLDPCVPPEPCTPAIELYANNENRIDVYYPNEEADAGIVQLIADPIKGGLIEIHAAEPLLSGRVLIGGSATDTGFVRLLGGSHKAEYRLLEMTSHTNNGGAMTFYDPDPTSDGRALMTSKSSPTEGTSIVGFNPQPEPPGIPAFEMGMNGAKDGPGSYFRLNNPQTGLLHEPLVSMTASSTEGGRLDVFYPGGEADAGIVQMVASPTEGGLIEIHAAEPLLSGRVLIGGSATDTGFVRLLGGSHKAEYRLLEMTSHTNNGGAMTFYDPDPTSDGRALMTSKSSPTEGTSIVGFNPQPEPPGIPTFDLGVNPGGKVGPGSYFRMYNPLTESLDMPLISMTTSAGEGGRLSFFGSVPPDDGRELLRMGNTPTEGIGIYGFNPQPEPPGIPALEILTGGGVKGPGGRVAVYNPSGPSAFMEGGIMQVGSDDVDSPSGLFQVSTTTCELTLTGESAAGDPPVISMVARADSAKVGIGTDNPSEALHVIGNIALTGEVVYITDTKLKTNIRPIDNAVEAVINMNGVHYNYRYNEYPEMKLSHKDQIGLLAQDVEKVLPELVHEDGNGTKYVAYTKLTAVLIEAIKEQQEIINRLEKRIEALEK